MSGVLNMPARGGEYVHKGKLGVTSGGMGGWGAWLWGLWANKKSQANRRVEK